jgi:hypothetical protein
MYLTKPQLQYLIDKNFPLDSFLSQKNPYHCFVLYFLKMHFKNVMDKYVLTEVLRKGLPDVLHKNKQYFGLNPA